MTERRPASTRRISKKVFAMTVALITTALAMVIMTRSEGTPQREKREALVPVKVAPPEKAVPVQLQAVGTVEAYATVSIKSRVDGELVKVNFREGQDVKKGDLLFTIDPRPYEAALKEARARLERDAALADKADMDARRYAELVAKNYVSSDKYEQFRANAEALRATVTGDRAALERAQLNLEYCYIKVAHDRPDRHARSWTKGPKSRPTTTRAGWSKSCRSCRSMWDSPSPSSIWPKSQPTWRPAH